MEHISAIQRWASYVVFVEKIMDENGLSAARAIFNYDFLRKRHTTPDWIVSDGAVSHYNSESLK